MQTFKKGLTTFKLVNKEEMAVIQAKKKKYNDPTAWELYQKQNPGNPVKQLVGFAGMTLYVMVGFLTVMYVAGKFGDMIKDPFIYLGFIGVFIWALWSLFSHFDRRFK